MQGIQKSQNILDKKEGVRAHASLERVMAAESPALVACPWALGCFQPTHPDALVRRAGAVGNSLTFPPSL